MADIPFLGCKISLISKCDIRYEGILYCVDAKESTIALSKVKSHGTENRADPNSASWVAPKNDIYDIIIFRASDVKDLRVDAPEPPGLSDPAIISAHHSYPGQPSISSTSSFNTNSNNSSNQTTSLSNTNSGGNAASSTLNSNGSLSNNTSGPSNTSNKQHPKPLLPFLPTGPNNQESHQHQSSQLPTINYSSAAANAQRRARHEKSNEDHHAGSSGGPHNRKPGHHDMNRKDDRGGGRPDKRDDYRRDDRRHRPDDRRDDKRDDRKGSRDRRRGSSNNRISRSGGGYDRNHMNGRYINDRNNSRRGGPNSRDNKNSNKNNGPPYRRGPMQGGRRPRSGDRSGAPRGPRKSIPLRFEGEYDFEDANKQFLELETKLKSLNLKGDNDKESEPNGDGLNSKSPTGNSESGSGYDSEDRNTKNGDSKDEITENLVCGEFYDKTKSFFDNISCEASEKSQGKVNKPDWRKERQLNAETFGVSASYRRGGYRGRTYGSNGYHRR